MADNAEYGGVPTAEQRDQWRRDAEWAYRHGKIEDGVPPSVILRLLDTLDAVEALADEWTSDPDYPLACEYGADLRAAISPVRSQDG